MIVGFDHYTPAIFNRQIEFIQQSGLIAAMVGFLNAPREPVASGALYAVTLTIKPIVVWLNLAGMAGILWDYLRLE